RGDLLDHFGGTKRTQKTDEQLIATQERKIGLARDVIRAVAKHLHDNVSGGKYGSAIGKNLSTLLEVGGIGIASLCTGSRFDHDFEAGLAESWNHRGNQRDPALSRIAFLRNSNDHAAFLSRERIIIRRTQLHILQVSDT